MEKISEILPIWQPVGYSTHVITKRVSELISGTKNLPQNTVKTAHTGTLDPMAEGVIIVLLGKNRHNKYVYAKWKKTYVFEMILGLKTDTYDGLGLVTNSNLITSAKVKNDSNENTQISKENIERTLKSFVGKYTQTIPPYSAVKINGKPLHWYARNKKLNKIELPKREGEIFETKLISQKTISRENMVENIVSRIQLISGDLRQKEIISKWKAFESKPHVINKKTKTPQSKQTKYSIIKAQVTTSKGIYVRSLVQDIAKKLGTTAFTYSIIRTKNGNYSKENSKTLADIFGDKIKNESVLQSYN